MATATLVWPVRRRDVETGPNLGVLAVFPSNGATCRPLPSTWAQFPRFGGTMRHSDAHPPASAFAPVPSEHLRFAPSDARSRPGGL